MFDLTGMTALVTGASGGIGSAIARALAAQGARLAVSGSNAEKLEAFRAGLGGDHIALACNLSDKAQVDALVPKAVEALGQLDILVNNAGWDIAKPFLDTEPDLWEKIIAINLRGPLNLHKAVLPHLIANGGGKVINIASDAGRVGSSGESVYSACKGGLIAFSKTVAREYARDNVRVNVVCPGPTDTALLRSFVGEGEYGQKIYDKLQKAIPLKRLGQPADIPGMIAFFASSDADFITGQVISVSGGLTMHG